MSDLDTLLILAQTKGADREYIEWVQCQESCLGGGFDQWIDGDGRSVAAHVRRAADSGTAYKAPYAVIPMSKAEHQSQHKHGEAGCLERHLGGKWTREEAADWFDQKRIEHLERWVGL